MIRLLVTPPLQPVAIFRNCVVCAEPDSGKVEVRVWRWFCKKRNEAEAFRLRSLCCGLYCRKHKHGAEEEIVPHPRNRKLVVIVPASGLNIFLITKHLKLIAATLGWTRTP